MKVFRVYLIAGEYSYLWNCFLMIVRKGSPVRNLLIIHLESLNYMNYRLHQEWFPNLQKWEGQSFSFQNYFSSATSTWMVVGDFLYGGLQQYETCASLTAPPEKYYQKSSLFDLLKERGYETSLLVCGDPGEPDFSGVNRKHIAGFHNTIQPKAEGDDFFRGIENAISAKRPFALMVFNFVSNISFNHYVPHGRLKSGLDRWKEGYQALDVWVGDILQTLESKNILEQTTVVFYGDHGDDFYEHGLHGGLTHAIEPYGNLIHTPLWIYDVRLTETGSCQQLFNTKDLAKAIEAILDMPEQKSFSWHDLALPVWHYALSRNAYAAQAVREDSFQKGYSLTDGQFLLLVNSHGLALYDIQMDLQCQNNLLRFFIYRDGVLYLNRDLNDSLRHHYQLFLNMYAIRHVRQTFYKFRKQLQEEVLGLFNWAGCPEKFMEMNFQEIQNG